MPELLRYIDKLVQISPDSSSVCRDWASRLAETLQPELGGSSHHLQSSLLDRVLEWADQNLVGSAQAAARLDFLHCMQAEV